MIEVKNVNKTFGDHHVLKDINAKFEQGKVNLIIGQSGSGKSVLTKCIIGLYNPDTGKVFYDGRDFTEMDRNSKKEIRKEIGMLFQGSALFDSMTVEENIMFPLTMFTKQTKKENKTWTSPPRSPRPKQTSLALKLASTRSKRSSKDWMISRLKRMTRTALGSSSRSSLYTSASKIRKILSPR